MKKVILKTKRLVLRPLRKGDERMIYPLANNPKISRFLLFDYPLSLEKEKKFVSQAVKNFGKGEFQFLALEKKTKELVGWIKLMKVSRAHKRASIAVWVAESKWRKGFGEGMCKAVFDFAFKKLKLNKIEYGVFKGNKASEKLIRKFGGRLEGVKRQHFLKCGRFVDVKLFSILASEWKKRKKEGV